MSLTATSTSVDKLDDIGVIGNSEMKEIPKQVLQPEPSTSISPINKKDEPSKPVQSTQRIPVCLDQGELHGSTSHQASGPKIGQQLSSSFSGRSMENSDLDKIVWINGITEGTTIAQLQDLCRPYGTPVVIRLFKQKNKSDSNALVAMMKMATAEDADRLVNKLPLHFDKKLNVTISKKTRRRCKREGHSSSGGTPSETMEEDGTEVKKPKQESRHSWPLNQTGDSQEPLEKNNSWSLLRNNIKDLKCMGFSVLEDLTCLDGEEQQAQRNKNSNVKEDFKVGINPIQDTDNSLTDIKGENRAYPKSTEEFTQIMRKYLANLIGNEVGGPPQGSLDHSQLSKEVQSARKLTEEGPKVIHERIKENYTLIKEWILTTCVPLSMAFKLVSQTDVNKELLSGALKCLLGIVHQISQLKVKDLELANEYENNKMLITGKGVTTSDASVQAVPETVSEVVQTLRLFSQSKYVQTESESKLQEKCEKTNNNEKCLAKSKPLGVTSVAKVTLTNSCKLACSKGDQTESTCLRKDELDIINDSSKVGRRQYVPSDIDSCLSGNLTKSTPSTSHISHDSQAQQNFSVTENTMQCKSVMTKPVKGKGISSGVKEKKVMNTVPQSKETGSSLGVKKIEVCEERKENPISVKDEASEEQTSTSTANEAKKLRVESKCIKGKAVQEEETTKVTQKTTGSEVEGKCVERKLSKGKETSSIAYEIISPVVEGKCVKEETNLGPKVFSSSEGPKNPTKKFINVKTSEEKEMACKVEETKVSSEDERKGIASIVEETKKTVLEGKYGLENASKSVTGEAKRPLTKYKCVEEKASVHRETKGPLVKGKSGKGKANVPQEEKIQFVELGSCGNPEGKVTTEQIRSSEETETFVVNDKNVEGNVNERGNIMNVVKEKDSRSVERKHVRGKVNKEQEIVNTDEVKRKSTKGKCGNEKACKTQEMLVEETKMPKLESKHVNEMTSMTKKKTSENIEDPKVKIEPTDSVMMLGRGKRELRDSKSSVHSKTSEMSKGLEDLHGSKRRENKVKVKCITSSKMIVDIDEVIHLNEESKVNTTKLPLSEETVIVNLPKNKYKMLRSYRREHDMEGKIVKMEIDDDSQNRGEKRKVEESECMDKKKSRVNEKEIFYTKSGSSLMEDSGKRGCRSTRSQTSIGSAVNLKTLEKVNKTQIECEQGDAQEKSDMSRNSEESRRQDNSDEEEHMNTGTKDLNKGKAKCGRPSPKGCKLKRNIDNKKKIQKSDQSRETDKSEGLKEGMDVKGSGKDQIEDRYKSEKENGTGAGEQKICEESEDEEEEKYTEMGSKEVQESCKEMMNKNRVKSTTLRTRVVEKAEKASRSKLEEKQRSKDGDDQNAASECEQGNQQGKQKCQTQTKEGKQVDVKAESEEASRVSSRRLSGKSKGDGITASRKRMSTSERSNRHKKDSEVATEGRQAVNKRAGSSLSSSSSSSQESRRQRKESKEKLSDVSQTRLSRRRNPVSPEGRKLRSRIPCAPSKLHRRSKTPHKRNRRERYLDKSKFQEEDNTRLGHMERKSHKTVYGHQSIHGSSFKHHGSDDIFQNHAKDDYMENVTDDRYMNIEAKDCSQSGYRSQKADFHAIVNDYFRNGSERNKDQESGAPSHYSTAETGQYSVAPYSYSHAESWHGYSYPSDSYYNDPYYYERPYDPQDNVPSTSAEHWGPLDHSGHSVPQETTSWEYTSYPYPQ